MTTTRRKQPSKLERLEKAKKALAAARKAVEEADLPIPELSLKRIDEIAEFVKQEIERSKFWAEENSRPYYGG